MSIAPLYGARREPVATELQRPRLQALRLDGPIQVDGDLSESAWQRAAVGTNFTQREPADGKPATETTELRVVYDESTLFIGIVALDSDPQAIIAREMGRDVPIFRDDSVVVLLDTFRDRRNGYFFETNPNGARTDMLVTDEGRDRNRQWDGVWTVKTKQTPQGWQAEMAIPFSTLRFDPELDTWGINVRRLIRHKNEEVYWSPIPREADVFRFSMAGDLTGLGALKASRQLDVKPFLIAGRNQSSEDGDVDDGEVGVDVKWGLTRALAVDLTLNTDFAEVEVDEQRVNLTRFSLFFPEKREFFLENAGTFEFGSGSGGRSPLLKVFFSRRIGIGEDGEQVPIEWGGRLTGRVGAWNLGLLNVTTDRLPEAEEGPIPQTAFSVVRAKRDLGRRSTLGMIFTHRDERGPDWNRVFGLDADLKPTSKLSLSAFWTQSDDGLAPAGREAGGEEWAAGGGMSWRGRVLDVSLSYFDIREGFNPELGFLLRRGIKRYNPEVRFEPRPGLKGIRAFQFSAESEYVTRTDGTLESREIRVTPFGIRTTGEDRMGLTLWSNTERLFEPFEIDTDVVIAPGRYDYVRFGYFMNTNERRKFSLRTRGSFGDFFGGERLSHSATMRYRASRFLRAETAWSHNDVTLPGGDFTTNLYSQRLNVSFTPELLVNSFLQYNDSGDLVGFNFRFNWIYQPGADLFVVYNQNWDAPTLSRLVTADRQVIVKFTYLLRL